MSEPSGDLPEKFPAPAHLPPAPRVNPPSVFHAKDAPPPSPAAPPGMQEFFAWMLQTGGPGAAATETAESEQVRRPLPKEQKKFQRADPAAKTAGGPGAALPDGPVTALPRPDAPAPPTADRALTGDLADAVRVRRERPRAAPGPWLALGLPLGALALAMGSFLLGRTSVPKAAPATVVLPVASQGKPAAGSDEALALVDQAMAAEAGDDYRRGYELLRQTRQAGGRVAGLDYHLALLAYESGDMAQVLPLLNRSQDEGEEAAACLNLRGMVANRQGGITKGLADLAAAARLDPFNPKYLFFLGEAQRRGGQPQAALGTLRQALARQRDPGLISLYQLKIRLTQIELGQEQDFAAELAARLAEERPPVDWLLTAAALEMRRGDFAAAAGSLDRARARAEDQTFNLRLRDYFFVGFAHERLLARFFAPLAAAPAKPMSDGAPPPANPPPNPPEPAAR